VANQPVIKTKAHPPVMETDSSALCLLRLFDDGADDLAAVIAAYTVQTAAQPLARGSSTGRHPNIDRGVAQGHERLVRDYFTDSPVYSARTFRRRFRMRRELYLRIFDTVERSDDYFQQRPDATGMVGLSALQKCTTAIRHLVYGRSADAADEHIRIGESTAIKGLKRFCAAVIDVFVDEYLRAPTKNDIQRLLAMHRERWFVGMLGSFGCMHWGWEKCPTTAWSGQYTGKESKPTIVLEAVASQDLWIWHAFVGMPGSVSDINVLNRSDLFSRLANKQSPTCDFTINPFARSSYNLV
jgi:hypothetical protein